MTLPSPPQPPPKAEALILTPLLTVSMAGGLQAFEICEDYPGGEVCKEMEVEVCQPSDNEEDKLCPEVEVQLLSLNRISD